MLLNAFLAVVEERRAPRAAPQTPEPAPVPRRNSTAEERIAFFGGTRKGAS